MELKCSACKKKYKPLPSNTVILGVYIESTCPFCMVKYEGKFINFIGEQVSGQVKYRPEKVAEMQKLARYVELNVSEYYKRGKRGK